ncbi:MAG: hypothetical protein R2818_15770 [Flavobacteriales bacterium]
MNITWSSVRLFRVGVHLWLVGYLLSATSAAEWLWEFPVARLPGPPGPLRYLTHAFGTWLPDGLAIPAVGLLLLLALRGLFRPARWWSSFLIWMLYTSLMNLAWSAASGGQQLMANVLFWMIFLPNGPDPKAGPMTQVVGGTAFWIIRMQLVLAYAVTVAHKFTGHYWMDGHAVGIVATDPGYGPAFLGAYPALLVLLTYGVLIFQAGFPVALWWRPTRHLWMWMGLVFHLGTGISLGILDMAFAFLVCYLIWFDEGTAQAWWARLDRWKAGLLRPTGSST